MKYCNATKISTQQCYNNEFRVDSLHDDFDSALESSDNRSIIEVADSIQIGDSINDSGELWEQE